LLVLEDVARQRGAVVGADAELGQVDAVVAVPAQGLEQPLALATLRRGEPAVTDGEPRRLVGEPDRGQRAGDDRPLSPGRRDEALAAGQVPESARRRQVAVVRDALAPGQVEAKVRPARAGEVGLVRLAE